MDASNILAHLPIKGIDLIALAIFALWLWPRLPAREGKINRRLKAIRDDDVRYVARVRLITGDSRYCNKSGIVTNRGLRLAVKHSKFEVQQERRNSKIRHRQQRGILDL